jgi:preprotein translocase subunit SecE
MINSLTQYISGAMEELRHIRWPTRQQAIRFSAIVIACTGVAALFFGIADFGLAQFIQMLLSWA